MYVVKKAGQEVKLLVPLFLFNYLVRYPKML